MTVSRPCGRAADNNRTDALMPARVFNHMFRIQARRRCQAAGHAFLFQCRQPRLDLGPVRPARIGQHFQFGLHPAAQRCAYLEQAFDRRDRSQSDDDAALHVQSAGRRLAVRLRQACDTRPTQGNEAEQAMPGRFGLAHLPAKPGGGIQTFSKVGLLRGAFHGGVDSIRVHCLKQQPCQLKSRA